MLQNTVMACGDDVFLFHVATLRMTNSGRESPTRSQTIKQYDQVNSLITDPPTHGV